MSIIDLRSDTLTHPSVGMLQAMASAQVGDDAYGEDRSVVELQDYCAAYFGKPAALFMPSGTMSNQVALRVLTQPGDEVICDSSYHINFFESAQTADLGKVVLNPLSTHNGILTIEAIQKGIEAKARWNNNYSSAKLIWLENSISTHAGKIFPFDTLKEINAWCHNAQIPIFLDGARLLNASVATKIHCSRYASLTNALTICFSKGLGAPFGSILLGERDFIARAARYRKWFGGGLHQSGFMAAAALYALKNNVERLAIDHENATLLSKILAEESRFRILKAETNMVVFGIKELEISAKEFVRRAAMENILLMAWRGDEIRAVTSSNVNRSQIINAGHQLLRLARAVNKPESTSKLIFNFGISNIKALPI